MSFRIYLSPPDLLADESERVAAALASGWVAPLGPEVDAFEQEFATTVGSSYAVALSSGTAALHLALVDLGIGPSDEVAVSTFTFAASANPVVYQGATPVFIDSEPLSWNMDPNLLEQVLRDRARTGRQLRAIILVHLYGQTADLDAIRGLAMRFGVPLIEDAAEALGATYKGRAPGSDGRAGVFSFNGNKIITTSGGGMLVTDDESIAAHVRKLATQAREPVVHYEHTEIGYNYRLSNVLAALGRAQLRTLDERVRRRRETFAHYGELLSGAPGVEFMPDAAWGGHSRWLTCLTIDPALAGVGREDVQQALLTAGIEARPVWKPLHLQPVFRSAPAYVTGAAEQIFRRGLCLPSGTRLTHSERDEVAHVILARMSACRARQAQTAQGLPERIRWNN